MIKKWCFRAERMGVGTELAGSKIKHNVTHKKEQDVTLLEITDGLSGALNNNKDYEQYKSYSMSLGVSLFKYYKNSALLLMEKKIDSVSIKYSITGLKWSREEIVDMDYLWDEEKRKHRVYELLKEDLQNGGFEKINDIDGWIENLPITYVITGITVDVSTTQRKEWNKSYDVRKEQRLELKGFKTTGLKRTINYEDDQEVVSTMAEGTYYCIQTMDCIEILRFLYILIINGLMIEYGAIKAAYFEKKLGDFDICEVEAMKLLTEYMEENADYEKDKFNRIFYIRDDVEMKLQKDEDVKKGTFRILKNLSDKGREKVLFNNEDLLKRLLLICEA